MNMHRDLKPSIKTELDVLTFLRRAIAYRDNHREDSAQIARYAYAETHELKTGVVCASHVELLRTEMIALEAPGWPPEELNTEPEDYDDMLWGRLGRMVNEEIEKRTV